MVSTAKALVILRRCEGILLHSPEEVAGISVLPVLDQVRELVGEIEESVLAPRKRRRVVDGEEDQTPETHDLFEGKK